MRKVKETYCLTNFGKTSIKKNHSQSKPASKHTLFIMFLIPCDLCHFEASQKRYILDKAKNSFFEFFLTQIFGVNYFEKSEN